ncbi:MAG: transketolase C-terminal domain-containing protein, partial [Nitrososphaerota archaeon]
TNVPGLITVCPATPYDAKGLLIEASQTRSPVVFLERGRLYRADVPTVTKGGAPVPQLAALWNVPDGYYSEPFGKARTLRIGSGAPVATVVSWGTMLLESAIAAARFTEAHGGSIDVIDLRTLMPFDTEAIRASVKATNRAVVVTEEADLTSFGRHIHSWIAENFFWDLDMAPELVRAIAGPAAPYNAPEETGFYPTADHVYATLERFSRE